MTRQLLINEIKRLHLERREKREDILNDVYIFHKYPDLKVLYNHHRLRGERWHQLVREVLIFETRSVRYMYNRTMQLIRRIGQNSRMYFDIKTERGTYVLPDRLSDFNRLLELYKILFYDLFPGLTKAISLDITNEEHKSQVIRGNIHWSKTLSDPCNMGLLQNPLVFTQTRPTRRFDVPENIILMLSILRMKYDSIVLYEFNYADPLSKTEREKLTKIVEGCNQALKLTMLQDLIPITKKYLTVKPTDSRILSLESKVHQRIREHSPRNDLFRRLLHWRRMYRELNLRLFSFNTTYFPLDHIHNLDKMYELWILFELLDFLSQQGSHITINEFPRAFSFSYNKSEYELFYEKSYEGWSSIGAVPDFTIEKDGQIIAVMDAKNWLFESKKEAIYKMLGYMNNIDSSIGILFFPDESKLPKEKVQYGKELQHHKDQCLFNCVLYPSSSPEIYVQKIKRFTQMFDLITRSVD